MTNSSILVFNKIYVMRTNIKTLLLLYQRNKNLSKQNLRFYHGIPIINLYQQTTGQQVSNDFIANLKKKHPNIDNLSQDRLQCTLQILSKFGITSLEACKHLHVFCMNPIAMDNYGEILKECGFIKILPKHIIRYHTLIRSRTIIILKKEGLIGVNVNLEELLLSYFQELPPDHIYYQNFPESTTSLLTVRLSVLEKYLKWRLGISSEEFEKYCRNYLPLKHKPMSDIREALDIAQNEIKFSIEAIKRNGFVISSDPVNTKLIIENVESLAGLDIREAIRLEPAILKNNYNALLQIRNLLQEYRISEEAQRRYLKVYCMCPKTVKERLDELMSLKEYQLLSTNPRVLAMVIHKRKMMNRIREINGAKKQCYSLNHLVSSAKVFNNYISNVGHKVCGRDVAILINSSLHIDDPCNDNSQSSESNEQIKVVLKQLRRHKYWLHVALSVIDENIQFLKKRFRDEIIFNNCQLLLYPVCDVAQYIEELIKLRDDKHSSNKKEDFEIGVNYNNLKCTALTDNQILSLVLYEIEKKYHFSGDGVWAKQDVTKPDAHSARI